MRRLLPALFLVLLLPACGGEKSSVAVPSAPPASPNASSSADPSAPGDPDVPADPTLPSGGTPAPDATGKPETGPDVVVDASKYLSKVTTAEIVLSSQDASRLYSPEVSSAVNDAVSELTGGEFAAEMDYREDGVVASSYRIARPVSEAEAAKFSSRVKSVLPAAQVSVKDVESYRFRLTATIVGERDADKLSEAVGTSVYPMLDGQINAGLVEDGPFQLGFDGQFTEGADMSKVVNSFAKAVGVKPANVQIGPLA